MYWYLSTQQHMSNGLILISALLGVAILTPICLALEKRDRKAAAVAASKLENATPEETDTATPPSDKIEQL